MAAQARFEERLGFSPQPITVRGFANTDTLADLEQRGLIVASDGPHKRASRERPVGLPRLGRGLRELLQAQ